MQANQSLTGFLLVRDCELRAERSLWYFRLCGEKAALKHGDLGAGLADEPSRHGNDHADDAKHYARIPERAPA